MNDQSQNLIRAVTGPIILITVGVLFTLERMVPRLDFWHTTWPVLLIVVGLLKLLGGGRRRRSDYYAPPTPPPPPAPGERR
jgi:hypothetical protein